MVLLYCPECDDDVDVENPREKKCPFCGSDLREPTTSVNSSVLSHTGEQIPPAPSQDALILMLERFREVLLSGVTVEGANDLRAWLEGQVGEGTEFPSTSSKGTPDQIVKNLPRSILHKTSTMLLSVCLIVERGDRRLRVRNILILSHINCKRFS